MGRGRKNFFNDLAVLPWPVGLGVGALGYLFIAHGIPLWFARQGGALAQAFANGANPFRPLAWLFFALCAIAATASFLSARRKRRLLDTRTGLDSIAALGWRDFERLVGEAFRRQGYSVEETGLGGADGGIDLILRKGGRRTLVQCKQWRREKVPVNVVREMYGLLAHHGADEVRIAALGGFTPDAARFADGKPIELIDGPALLAMIREVQRAGSVAEGMQARVDPVFSTEGLQESSAPHCPRCDAPMVRRSNRRTGEAFWGCPAFPICRETM
ncbi:restriction endonuclease [Pseudoxanthomonas wuyuanensis]|uniref:Restriction system protein n=1 Tax=Pseudoxanthomonas wuyuanensis TaxID=1073196 RepID=A0A286DET6_9GAMM|nr:restriction endonuclease [Pseudoxanthomonas wuyuanensis]KAF1719942.1 restriction endonuclease [Pseudoxanthomonas wuyuanensis]SOD57245.1 restriction system protein [Pseudoxanthomonas wuyuanensis]